MAIWLVRVGQPIGADRVEPHRRCERYARARCFGDTRAPQGVKMGWRSAVEVLALSKPRHGRPRTSDNDGQHYGIAFGRWCSWGVDPDGDGWRRWPIVRCSAALEGLDDDHATAAAWTGLRQRPRFFVVSGLGGLGIARASRHGQQLTDPCDIVGAGAMSEQAVVADAMEAARQHVDEEAADELVGGERHDLLPLTTFGAVVLPLEGDAVAVERDEAAVGDGNAVGVARQISQHRLGSTERSLCIDDPLGFACRRQICRERVALYQRGVIAEKLQAACLMGRDQLLQEQSAEQPREHAHGQEEAWPAEIQCCPSGAMHPPGTMMWRCGWCVIAEPQVCSTLVSPIRAPRCLGSAAIVISVSADALNSRS